MIPIFLHGFLTTKDGVILVVGLVFWWSIVRVEREIFLGAGGGRWCECVIGGGGNG
jgi:hypothetical protein